MNKTAIKNFAVWARTTLLTAVKQKAFEYEITEDGEMDVHLTAIEGRLLTEEEKKQRRELIDKIKEDGYEQVMEQTAYIWFNRFIALRFMEVNGYLPSRVRVFTDDSGEFRPAILKEAMNLELDGLDREKVYGYLEEQNNEELYKYLLLTQCNALNKCLPYMFEKIDNYTELLFPSGLLKADSVIGRMISEIPEEDWTDQVQIIGWLYQYYNSELKDDTFARLKKNTKISKDRIPAATQLFTPDWIVRYMVENSLGRLWLEGHPNDSLKAEWKYYLEEAEQEPEVEAQLLEIRREYQNIKPEEIKVIDPCMGSGHILVAAFDVLMKIYTSCGWSERDAAKSIVENNLYGLDIDDRAGQLAYFSVMMEARKYNRRALNGELEPKVMAIEETKFMTSEMISYVANGDKALQEDLTYLKTVFDDGKEYGSILTVKSLDFDRLYRRFAELKTVVPENLLDQLVHDQALAHLKPIIMQAEILSGKFDAVITNPPYMGGSGMDARLSKYVKDHYPDSKSDLFAVFIERCKEMTAVNRYQAMITQHAWMFLSSYEKLRGKLLNVDTINMAHLGARAFEEIGGEVVQTTSFVMQKRQIKGFKGTYCRLIEPTTQQGKEDMFLAGENRYEAQQANFAKIPGSPVAYWVGDKILDLFDRQLLEEAFKFREGIHTADNAKFLRLWWEIKENLFIQQACSIADIDNNGRWVPYNKGGYFRRWWGNNEYVIGFDCVYRTKMLKLKGCVWPSQDMYFKQGGTWTAVTSGNLGVRYYPDGFLFDAGGQVVQGKSIYEIIALLNTKIIQTLADIMMPTINYKCGILKLLPDLRICNRSIEEFAIENIKISKSDWDSYETSWDFKKHPLV
ncbi:MAG: BREX-1 system adenine-specific DNA-methyltransferase PglX [Emergencia sp.]|nr:BREX-1 system adenine-specific DNA-methyltransferase PglX [Emergencia sp.]